MVDYAQSRLTTLGLGLVLGLGLGLELGLSLIKRSVMLAHGQS